MIKIILIIVAVFIVYCLIEMIRELRDFRVTKYRICSQKLNGIKKEKKIIFLSDLHNSVGNIAAVRWDFELLCRSSACENHSESASGSDSDRR